MDDVSRELDRYNVSKEMATVRKIQKEMAESQNTKTEIKNTFDGLINRLGMVEVSISED